MFYILLIVAMLATVAITLLYLTRPQTGRLHLWSGGVKTGKTSYAVKNAISRHKKAMKKWQRNFRAGRTQDPPPCLYSNMPLIHYPYKPLTTDIITLERQVEKGSIIYINEVSLVAGSLDIKDPAINDALLHFFKLAAHITEGYVILDTQSPMDLHFSCKRSLSTYWHILRSVTIPHIGILSIIEQRQVIDNEIKSPSDNAQKRDGLRDAVEVLLPRTIFVRFCPASIWKRFDQYAYHSLVEDKPQTETRIIDTEDGKVHEEVRIRHVK